MTLLRLELRRSRGLVLALGATLLGYGAVMGLMHPIMKANDELLREYMAVFPKGFLAAFGMSGTLSDPGVFFTTYVGSWLWPIVAAIAGLLVATRPVAVDLDRGFIDLALAGPVSRVRYLGASIAMQVLVLGVLALSAVLGLWTVGVAVGAPFDLGRFLLGALLCFAFAAAIAGASTLLAVLTLSRGATAGIVGGVLVAMYALFVVTQVMADWSWLAPLSAWHWFETTPLIDSGTLPVGGFALFGCVALAGWGLALRVFRGRDLAA